MTDAPRLISIPPLDTRTATEEQVWRFAIIIALDQNQSLDTLTLRNTLAGLYLAEYHPDWHEQLGEVVLAEEIDGMLKGGT